MKKQKCEIILHGSSRQFSFGDFESIKKAKEYIRDIDWKRPYTIIKINKDLVN